MRPKFALVIIAIAVGAAACGGSQAERVIAPVSVPPGATVAPVESTPPASGEASPTSPAAAGAPAPAVPQALNFTARQVGGGQIDPATYAGKPVAFWFWAPG